MTHTAGLTLQAFAASVSVVTFQFVLHWTPCSLTDAGDDTLDIIACDFALVELYACGRYMKQFSSPSLIVSTQVDEPSRLEGAEVSVAVNARVRPPAGALQLPPGKEGHGVAMQATAWAIGASPYLTNAPPKSPSRVDAGEDDEGNATALGSAVLSLMYVSV